MGSLYRRKQDAILGLDHSNLASTSDSLASAVARYKRGESDGKMESYHGSSITVLMD